MAATIVMIALGAAEGSLGGMVAAPVIVLLAFLVVGVFLLSITLPYVLPILTTATLAPLFGFRNWMILLGPLWLQKTPKRWTRMTGLSGMRCANFLVTDDERDLAARWIAIKRIAPMTSFLMLTAAMVGLLSMASLREVGLWNTAFYFTGIFAFGSLVQFVTELDENGHSARSVIQTLKKGGKEADWELANLVLNSFASSMPLPRSLDSRWIAIYEDMLLVNPMSHQIRDVLMSYYHDIGDSGRFEEHRTMVLNLLPSLLKQPKDINVYNLIWYAAIGSAVEDEARRLYAQIAPADPALEPSRFWLEAEIARKAGRFDEARKWATDAAAGYRKSDQESGYTNAYPLAQIEKLIQSLP
ncbi:hypothetical protein EON79_04200 [bacterium]|nr:MAG: hypothetical protein EON79_04200 [bacterium]